MHAGAGAARLCRRLRRAASADAATTGSGWRPRARPNQGPSRGQEALCTWLPMHAALLTYWQCKVTRWPRALAHTARAAEARCSCRPGRRRAGRAHVRDGRGAEQPCRRERTGAVGRGAGQVAPVCVHVLPQQRHLPVPCLAQRQDLPLRRPRAAPHQPRCDTKPAGRAAAGSLTTRNACALQCAVTCMSGTAAQWGRSVRRGDRSHETPSELCRPAARAGRPALYQLPQLQSPRRRARMASGARLCSAPRVLGTTQYVQRSLQPWMTLTQALSAESRRGTAMSSGMSTGSTATTWAPRSTCSSSSPILRALNTWQMRRARPSLLPLLPCATGRMSIARAAAPSPDPARAPAAPVAPSLPLLSRPALRGALRESRAALPPLLSGAAGCSAAGTRAGGALHGTGSGRRKRHAPAALAGPSNAGFGGERLLGKCW